MKYRINHFPSKQKPDAVRDVYIPLQYEDAAKYRELSRYAKIRQISTKHNLHPNKFIPQAFEKTRCRQYHETVPRRFIEITSSDKYHMVTSKTANRLDIIALEYYNDSTLWWVIADANPSLRFNPYHVPVGMSVRIPSISTLYKSGGVLHG